MPFLEKGSDLGWPEFVTQYLRALWIRTRKEPVVQSLEANSCLPQLAFGPFMPVDADLTAIRRIGTDFDESRTKVSVLHIKVIVIHINQLATIIKAHQLPLLALLGFMKVNKIAR